MAIHRRVYKQGNSLVVSLPGWMLEELGIGKADYFKIEYSKSGYLKLTPVSSESKQADRYSRTGEFKRDYDDELKLA